MLRRPGCSRAARSPGRHADAVRQESRASGQAGRRQGYRSDKKSHVPRLTPMATKVVMEALSPTMEEGRLVKWNKNEGDAVKNGDVLAEVETDKAIMELVARGDGVRRKRLANEGDSSPVGTLLAVIATADENIDSIVGSAAPATAAPAAASGALGPPTGPP